MLKQANLSFSVAAQSFGDDVTSIQFSTQDRNTAKLIFTIKEGKQPLNLTDAEGIVDLVMGDKSIFEDNKATVTAPLDGKLEYTITADQIRHPGRARGELQLISKDGQSIGGFRFNFTIKKALVDEYTGPVKEYYINDLEAVKEDVRKKANATASEMDTLIAEIEKTAESVKDFDVARVDMELKEKASKQEVQQISSQLIDTAKGVDSIENANATNVINLTNYLGNLQNIHPKVLHFPNKLWGFSYWMAYTPYPKGQVSAENPCIAVSNDMINWTVPSGLTNPLDPYPTDNGYNSDTHLLYREDTKTMEIWWRQVDKDDNKLFYRRTSTDGISWTEKELLRTVRYAGEMLSPAVIFKNGKYRVYFCRRREGTDEFVMYADYNPANKTWSNDVPMNIDWDTNNLRPWHLDVIETDIGLEMIVCCYDRDTGNNNTADLWHVIQYPDGTYSKPQLVIKRSENPTAIDYAGIYRSSFIKRNGVYYVFYSMIDAENNRWMSLSYGKNIKGLNGFRDFAVEKTGSRVISLAASLYPTLTDFDVSRYDVLQLNGNIRVESLIGGYSGKKITLVPMGSTSNIELVNGGKLLLGGSNITLTYSRMPAIDLICTNTTGTEWRLQKSNTETASSGSPVETKLTTENGWTGNIYCSKTPYNQVCLRGQLTVGTATSGTKIATIPEGYRPKSVASIPVWFQSAPFHSTLGLNVTNTGNFSIRPPASDTLKEGDVVQFNYIYQA